MERPTETIKKMSIETYTSIITLNVNELNSPTKTYRLDEWIQNQNPYICCLQDTHFRPRDIYQLKAMKAKGWKMIPMQIEIKSFSDKQNLREFSTTKLALQRTLNRLAFL